MASKGRNTKDCGNQSKNNNRSNNSNKSRNVNKKDNYGIENERISKSNDVNWYVSNEQMLKDVASFPFSRRVGTPLYMQKSNKSERFVHGGIAEISYLPTVGIGEDVSSSPLNMASKAIYSFVRHANSGSKVYDAPDLMLYLLAMDSCYMLWSWAVRLYGVSRVYTAQNALYPQGIMRAMGVSETMFNDIISNLAQLRTDINTFAVRLNSFAVPTKFSLYTRHMWLTQNIFLDAADTRAQAYVFNPVGYYTYNETSGAGLLSFTSLPKTYAEIKQAFDKITEILFNSEDIGIMSGDILKAYGAGNLFALGLIDENYSVLPAYDPIILTQIENMTITTINTNEVSINQSTTTGNLVQKGLYSTFIAGDQLINMHVESPTPADVMEATRLTCASPLGSQNVYCGSEVVVAVKIYFTPKPNETEYQVLSILKKQINRTEDTNKAMNIMALASNFKSFPILELVAEVGGSSQDWYLIGDIDNYTTMSPEDLYQLHTAAFIGMYGLPYSLTQV